MLAATFAAIVILLAVSAFFSVSETALTAVSRGRMHQMERDGSRAARSVNRLVANRERMIGAVLLGNTFINILASSLMTWVLEARLGPRTVPVTTVVMTVVILMFVEVLPKTLAIARTDRCALAVAAPLGRIVALLAPVVGGVQWLVWRVLRLFGVRQGELESAEAVQEEIRGSLELHHQEGSVERAHRDMIGGILDLAELRVGHVARHRTSIVSVDADLPPREIVRQIARSHHTRVPLWRGEPENIVAILHAKHLAEALLEQKGDLEAIDIASLAVPPWFVPDTTTLEEQIKAFRTRRTHFALVVDEYGALMGLITLEDILDEILGSIPDEHQVETPPGVRKRPDGSYVVDGAMPVRDLNREMDWHLPDEGATTIAGLIIQESGTIPLPGQRFAFFGFKFEVLRRQRNRVTQLRIIPPG